MAYISFFTLVLSNTHHPPHVLWKKTYMLCNVKACINGKYRGLKLWKFTPMVYLHFWSDFANKESRIRTIIHQVYYQVWHMLKFMDCHYGISKKEINTYLLEMVSALKFIVEFLPKHSKMILYEAQFHFEFLNQKMAILELKLEWL